MNKQELESLFNDIEEEFKMDHACYCSIWCDCWYNFKKKYLEKFDK